ncbi:MAG: transketolase [Candidatus Gracilibacteria bacterium]|jgi:transketolase
MNFLALNKKSSQLRIDVLKAINKAKSGHSGSCMSLIEIFVALYYGEIGGKKIVKLDAKKPGWEDQDYVLMLKGHAAIVQYAILADLGFFEKAELDHYRQIGSFLQAYPNIKVPGVISPISSHGYGLSVASGLAMSLKMDRKLNKVFAILGDGELQEGQVWEAALSAAHFNLNNLILFVDNDGLQIDGPTKAVMNVEPIQTKFEAFGWKVIHVLDGHDIDQILDAVSRAFTSNRQPVLIWCHTIKGRGIDFAENKVWYHDAPLSDAELSEVVNKLKNSNV